MGSKTWVGDHAEDLKTETEDDYVIPRSLKVIMILGIIAVAAVVLVGIGAVAVAVYLYNKKRFGL